MPATQQPRFSKPSAGGEVRSANLHFLTIAEAARLIESRELSPVELTQALLDRIAALDPQLNAFITVTGELALEQARAAEAEIAADRHRGPLHGIPFALKDLYNTAGILTSAHSKICIDNVPHEDATATARLYAAGAVLLGKLATHEFAHGGPSFDLPWPPARNPWNTAHYPGGSSSGSGAAVAAGLVPAALGTDTGSSIRSPASLCGIVGLKPTFGLVSRAGVIPNNFSFDYCGPLSRTVEDCAIVLAAIAGYDPGDPSSSNRPVPDYRSALTPDIRGLRIGVLRYFWEEDLPASDEMCRAMEEALDVFSRLGARLEDVRMRPLRDYWDVKVVIGEPEAFSIQQKDLMERPEDYGIIILGRLLTGCLFQAIDYVQAQRERRRMIEEIRPLYERYDVLVSAGIGPAQRLEAQRTIGFLDKWERPSIFAPFNVTGAPALVLCNGFSKEGLPLGMQIAGRPFDEQMVLKAAYAYERATPWHRRRPQLVPGAAQVPIIPPVHDFKADCLDPRTRLLVEMLAQRAGLKLDERLFALLCEAAPHALAMAGRIQRRRERADEPADVFRVPEAD